MSAIENWLRRSLHARAGLSPGLASGQTTPTVDVARPARTHRRKQIRTALLAAALAAAVVAVVGVPAGSTTVSGGRDRTPAPAGQTASTGPLSELPTGAPPAVDYLLDRTYVFADGDRVELDVNPGTVLDAAPYTDGVLVTVRSPTAASSEIADHLWFTRDGQLEHGGCGGEEVVLSADGAEFAYARTVRDCDRWGRWPVLQWGSTEDMLGTPRHLDTLEGQRVEPVGISTEQILYNATGSTGSSRARRVYTIGEVGIPVEVEGIARATAWDPATGRVAGCPSEGSCVVVDDRDGAVQLTLDPGEEPLSFSPDGQYLATVRGDGGRSTTITVLHVPSGDVVVAWTGDSAAFQGHDSVAWEGSGALLIAAVDTDGEGLVRLGMDGSTELATPITAPTVGGFLLPMS